MPQNLQSPVVRLENPVIGIGQNDHVVRVFRQIIVLLLQEAFFGFRLQCSQLVFTFLIFPPKQNARTENAERGETGCCDGPSCFPSIGMDGMLGSLSGHEPWNAIDRANRSNGFVILCLLKNKRSCRGFSAIDQLLRSDRQRIKKSVSGRMVVEQDHLLSPDLKEQHIIWQVGERRHHLKNGVNLLLRINL